MADDKIQKIMKGNTQATIELKLQPKEIGANETLLQLVYKHLDGITIDTIPFARNLASVVPGSSGAAGIGVDASTFTQLTAGTDQALWDEVDVFLAGIFNDPHIKADGSVPFTDDQSMGGNSLTNITNLTAVNAANMAIKALGGGELEIEGESFFKLRASGGQFTIIVGGATVFDVQDDVSVTSIGSKKIVSTSPRIIDFKSPVRYSDVLVNQQAGPGTTQGTQPVDAAVVIVGSAISSGDAITLPDTLDFCQNIRGATMWVKNNTAADTVLVFPDTGATINQLATNAAITLLPGEAILLYVRVADTWVTLSGP